MSRSNKKKMRMRDNNFDMINNEEEEENSKRLEGTIRFR